MSNLIRSVSKASKIGETKNKAYGAVVASAVRVIRRNLLVVVRHVSPLDLDPRRRAPVEVQLPAARQIQSRSRPVRKRVAATPGPEVATAFGCCLDGVRWRPGPPAKSFRIVRATHWPGHEHTRQSSCGNGPGSKGIECMCR